MKIKALKDANTIDKYIANENKGLPNTVLISELRDEFILKRIKEP